jgi:putative addiction module antidote
MTALRLRKIGNSVGLILPKDALDRHNLSAGDMIRLTDNDKGLAIERSDDEFSRQMEAARHVMKRRFSALRELAK